MFVICCVWIHINCHFDNQFDILPELSEKMWRVQQVSAIDNCFAHLLLIRRLNGIKTLARCHNQLANIYIRSEQQKINMWTMFRDLPFRPSVQCTHWILYGKYFILKLHIEFLFSFLEPQPRLQLLCNFSDWFRSFRMKIMRRFHHSSFWTASWPIYQQCNLQQNITYCQLCHYLVEIACSHAFDHVHTYIKCNHFKHRNFSWQN